MKAHLIREAIAVRYPCAELPRGAASELAREFEVSRSAVGQIVRAIGAVSLHHSHRLCAGGCGRRLIASNKAGICKACRWVTLPCEYCGAPNRRRASDLAYRQGRAYPSPTGAAVRQGRVFCNRACFGKWAAREHGFGSARRAAVSQQGEAQ